MAGAFARRPAIVPMTASAPAAIGVSQTLILERAREEVLYFSSR
jgi:hypothetical protein